MSGSFSFFYGHVTGLHFHLWSGQTLAVSYFKESVLPLLYTNGSISIISGEESLKINMKIIVTFIKTVCSNTHNTE